MSTTEGDRVRVTVVHGYYLHDSGSGTYVRELTRELVRQGHDVTLVCQERRPELYDFIDSVYLLDETNTVATALGEPRSPRYPGRCRLVRPDLRGRLLVYVDGPFPGFDPQGVKAFQDAPTDWITGYVTANLTALRNTFALWPPAVVLANHAVMQPYVVRQALAGAAPYTVTVHGSELNFSIKRDPRLEVYTIDGLDAAAAVAANTPASAQDVVAWAQAHGLDIHGRTHVVPPGIDTLTFAPAPDRAAAIEALRREVPLPDGFDVGPEQDILAFAGRLMWTKGIQHAVAALPLIAGHRRQVRLLVAGDGPARRPLEQLAACVDSDDPTGARRLAGGEDELKTLPEFGPVVPERGRPDDMTSAAATPVWRESLVKVAFLGHLSSTQVARVFAAADVSLAPSVFPEALGLVVMEALSAGALPLAAYHSGLASVIDVVADSLADPRFTDLAPGTSLTDGLARLAVHVLEGYPTADPAFRRWLHDLSKSRFSSWENVAHRYLELGGATTSP